MARGLHLLFSESDQQSYKQPAKEAPGCPDLPDYVKSVYGVGYKFEI